MCDCYDGYEGVNCTDTSPENLYPPVFETDEYTKTIREDENVPQILLVVNATDGDNDGKNAEILYSIEPSSLLDVDIYLEIDLAGSVILKKPIPRTIVPSGNLTVIINAEDRGIPRKSDTAELTIFIIDVNECPVVTSPTQGQVFYVNESTLEGTHIFTVMAYDVDFGLNKEIIYSLVETELVDINEYNGTVFISAQTLPKGEFLLTIQVADKASTPCVVELSVVLKVFSKDNEVDQGDTYIMSTEDTMHTTVEYLSSRHTTAISGGNVSPTTEKENYITALTSLVVETSSSNTFASTTEENVVIETTQSVRETQSSEITTETKTTPPVAAVSTGGEDEIKRIEITASLFGSTTSSRPDITDDISTPADPKEQTPQSDIEEQTLDKTALIAVGVVLGVVVIISFGIISLVCIKYSQAQAAKMEALAGERVQARGTRARVPTRSAWRPYYY